MAEEFKFPEQTEAEGFNFPESSDAGQPQIETNTPGFTEGFDLGGGEFGVEAFTQGGTGSGGFMGRLREANLGVRLGEVVTERTYRALGFDEEADSAEQAEKFEKWQPLIWDAQDNMNAIANKSSDEYQIAWENVQTLRRNMRDDLKGEYNPESNFSLSDLVKTVKDMPGFMAGRLLSDLMLDPGLLLVPGGMFKAGELAAKYGTKAKLAAEAAGAATVAAGWTGLEEVVAQREKAIDAPLDFKSVSDAMVVGGAFGLALPFAEKAPKGVRAALEATKVKDVWNARTVANIEKNAQQIYLDSVTSGNPIDKDVAINIAVAKHQNLREEVISNKDVFMAEDVLQQIEPDGKGFGVKEFVLEKAEAAGDKWNKFTQPITSTLRNMGYPNIARRLNEHDMNLGTDIHKKQEVAHRFSELYGKLDKNEQRLASININNGTFDEVRGNFSPELNKAYDDVRTILDEQFVQMKDAGIEANYIKDYFPREFDYERFAKDNDIVLTSMNEDFAKAINKKLGDESVSPNKITNELVNRHLTSNEIAMIMQKKTAQMSPDASINTATNNLQARTVDQINPELMKYYSDPRAALHNQINRNAVKIHDRRFFGGPELNKGTQPGAQATDEEMMNLFIESDLNNLVNKGRVRLQDVDKIKEILQARFIGAKKPTSKVIGGAKNIMYALTLGNPISASTQLGDLAAATYMNGIKDSLNGVIGNAGKDVPGFSMDDFGLQHIPEMETMGFTKKFAELSMKFGGFQAIDRLGKNAILNSTYRNLRNKMMNPKLSEAEKFKYFKDRYGARLGDDEVQKIMDGVASGDPANPHARLAMYSDLTRVQPVSMSEMPVGYMNHPDARIAYMLKTFTLKQIDLMRQESLNIIADGVKNKDAKQIAFGAMTMGKIIGTIGLGNAGIDYTKRWIKGDEDLSFTNNAFNSIMRNYGLSQYTLDKVMKGDLSGAAVDLTMPPFSTIQKPLWSAFGVDNGARVTDLLPVVGKLTDMVLDHKEKQENKTYGY